MPYKSGSSVRPLASLVLFVGLIAPAAVAQPARSPDPALGGPADPALTVLRPLTREERFHWFVDSTVGPKSLGAGVISAAWGTAFNNPEEYGPLLSASSRRKTVEFELVRIRSRCGDRCCPTSACGRGHWRRWLVSCVCVSRGRL